MTTGKGLGLGPIAQLILAAVEQQYSDAGVVLPERRWITAGQTRLTSWDAEQVVVGCNGVGVGQAVDQPSASMRVGNPIGSAGLRHAVFAVQIVRAHPEPDDGTNLPTVAELTAAGLAAMTDAGLLSQALVEACAAVKQHLRGPLQGSVLPGVVDTIGPSGGMAGVEGTITATAAWLA